MENQNQIVISLQPKQKLALEESLNKPVFFFGGAKGGGKSHLVRAREVIRRLKHRNTRGLIIRKTFPELLANHIRPFFKEYPQTRQWYNKSEKTIYYPNGSTTEFSYLKNTDDVYTYQGREYEDITIDEITQHEEEVFKILRSSLRTANSYFAKEAITTMFLTGNPGGIGHAWCKRLFIDKSYTENEEPDDFGFLQAFVQDNKALLDADPNYVKRLMDLPEEKRRAYLYGDWDVFTGQVFSTWRKMYHVIPPTIPSNKNIVELSMDWGYSEKSAFAGYLHAIIKSNYDGQTFNRVITFKEWCDNQKSPQEWAKIIHNYIKDMKIAVKKGVTDPAMHNTQTDGSISIAQLMQKEWKDNDFKLNLERGNNNRIARVATVQNWLRIAPDGLPYWMVTEDCPKLIETLPMLVYDEHNVDDVDTTQFDHPYDSAGYFLMGVKFTNVQPGAYSGTKGDTIKRVYDSSGMPIINPKDFFEDMRLNVDKN